MFREVTVYTMPLLIATGILIVSALYLWWRRRYLPGVKTAMLIILAGAEWSLGYALELGSVTLTAKVFWDKMQFIGIVIIPAAWLVYMLQYSGREKVLTRRNLALMSIVPIITLILVFTNEAHGLIWWKSLPITKGPFILLDKEYGLGFWIFVLYANLAVLIGVFLLIQIIVRSRHLYRWQTVMLLFAVLFPWIGSIVQLFIFPYLSLTPLAFTVSSIIAAWSLDRLRRGDIMAVSREIILDGMSDCVMVLDGKNHIMDLNSAAQGLIGYTFSQAAGKTVEELWPPWSKEHIESLLNGSKEGKEVVFDRGDGQPVYDVRLSSLNDWRGQPVSKVIVFRDITERVRSEEKLRKAHDELECRVDERTAELVKSNETLKIEIGERLRMEEIIKGALKEKEVLLKEIHHRVKNNLQIISSLLRLQSGYIQDEKTLEMLKESQNQVRSMALIHEKLYRSEDLAQIYFDEYIRDLTDYLLQSNGAGLKATSLKVDADRVFLNIDTAIPCGLIINELVSNCLKHAFPDGRKGRICIRLHSVDHHDYTLIVDDNGVGFPQDLDFRNTQTLGLQLVNTLVEQLEGRIRLEDDNGTTFEISFSELKHEKI